jgi:hypothetical protein
MRIWIHKVTESGSNADQDPQQNFKRQIDPDSDYESGSTKVIVSGYGSTTLVLGSLYTKFININRV